jgi:Leucine-rich repeat (LRR) protein
MIKLFEEFCNHLNFGSINEAVNPKILNILNMIKSGIVYDEKSDVQGAVLAALGQNLIPKLVEYYKNFEIFNSDRVNNLINFVQKTDLKSLKKDDEKMIEFSTVFGRMLGHIYSEVRAISFEGKKDKTLPVDFAACLSAEKIYITHTKIQSIPTDIFTNCKYVEYLKISHNQLTEIPREIVNMYKLGILNINGNQITTLPNVFDKLEYLNYLQAADNKLTTLPYSLKKCTNLKYLDVSGNNIPSEIIAEFQEALPNCEIFS